MSTIAIEFQRVTKTFARHGGQMLLRERLQNFFSGRSRERFVALKDVSFTLPRGQGLAVLGSNGAGKSTLLNLAAGIARPDSGRVQINGRVAPLLELGSGFHPDLTGAENVVVNAALIGLTRKRTRQLFDEIVEFADIGDFISEPLRTYSTGMMMRLAFAVAINMDPDILLIDEILGVGDVKFQQKCFERIRRFRTAGHTVLCVSHSPGMVEELCSEAIWLDHGHLVLSGPIGDVAAAYEGRGAVSSL
jgi:lipopolysaccharide transport system ATP-binding protein